VRISKRSHMRPNCVVGAFPAPALVLGLQGTLSKRCKSLKGQTEGAETAKKKPRGPLHGLGFRVAKQNLLVGHICGDWPDNRKHVFLVLVRLVHHEYPENEDQQGQQWINR
jgi:hypothetical protein